MTFQDVVIEARTNNVSVIDNGTNITFEQNGKASMWHDHKNQFAAVSKDSAGNTVTTKGIKRVVADWCLDIAIDGPL